MKTILIAGSGNIFQGDDAFGCEVIQQLKEGACPEEVTMTDFGIRNYDLAYALNNEFDEIILIQAASRGERPGTVYLIEPDAQSLNPVSVIQMARRLGGVSGKVYVVGCEPAVLECERGKIGLSATVRAAVPQAVQMIESLVNDILNPEPEPNAARPRRERKGDNIFDTKEHYARIFIGHPNPGRCPRILPRPAGS